MKEGSCSKLPVEQGMARGEPLHPTPVKLGLAQVVGKPIGVAVACFPQVSRPWGQRGEVSSRTPGLDHKVDDMYPLPQAEVERVAARDGLHSVPPIYGSVTNDAGILVELAVLMCTAHAQRSSVDNL